MKPTNTILGGYGTTIFEVMSQLARKYDAINLGQGFPDGNGPEDMRLAAAEALQDQPNQYPPMMGVPELRQAVADHDRRFYDLRVRSEEVMVTSGATEALAACLFGLLNPGDEVVVFAPLYDCYLPIIHRAGAVAKVVYLEPPHWRIPTEALEEAFGERTKLVLLNTPMNPSGKVYSSAELETIARLILQHDTYAVCDEVYEHLVFGDRVHIPLVTLPAMRERCLRIGSAGKSFSLTGWKVGYVVASPALLAPVAKAHQFLTFATPPNLQRAVAVGLRKSDIYFDELRHGMQHKRDLLANGLREIGFRVADCDGTYFLNADFRPLGFRGSDEAYCRHITQEAGVAGVPFSAFYPGGSIEHLARFCFCKNNDTLCAAVERLALHATTCQTCRGPERRIA